MMDMFKNRVEIISRLKKRFDVSLLHSVNLIILLVDSLLIILLKFF